VQTRNYVVMREEDDVLDLMALAAEASNGILSDLPLPTLTNESAAWVEAETAGIPERVAPPSPWAPRTPPTPAPAEPATPTPERAPARP
jgi:hypothetical protein